MLNVQKCGEKIVRRLSAGDHRAFDEIYTRHNASMIRVATAILHSRASAEEVTQDTWIAVLRNIDHFEGRSSLAGWIFTILVNKARTRARRDGRSVSLDGCDRDDTMANAFDARGHWRNLPDLWNELTPERIISGRQVLDHVTDAIDALPSGQRAVLTLRCQQELEAGEVCEILGLSAANMRVLLHRARSNLRKTIDELAK